MRDESQDHCTFRLPRTFTILHLCRGLCRLPQILADASTNTRHASLAFSEAMSPPLDIHNALRMLEIGESFEGCVEGVSWA